MPKIETVMDDIIKRKILKKHEITSEIHQDFLNRLENTHNNLFDFENLTPRQIHDIRSIMKHCINNAEIAIEKLHEALDYHHQELLEFHNLPDTTYNLREVVNHNNLDIEYIAKIAAAKGLLRNLIYDSLGGINLQNDKQLNLAIKSTQGDVKKLLTTYKKIANLQPLEIDGQIYFELDEQIQGVTEKVALISQAALEVQLDKLSGEGPNNLNDFIANNYKFNTNAILKLPKHGDIKEVQREAYALNISRMLDLNTTLSTMVTFKERPALFVPFSEITLLGDYATGKEFTSGVFDKKTYFHYSTFNAVGEGLCGNEFIEDFGKAISLAYICSDTDFVGGYNQNKALQNDKDLFIFDQVIMLEDKFELDSRLSLIPSQTFLKHTRHGNGRNRQLFEDSAFDEKFASIIKLKDNTVKIYKYIDFTIEQNTASLLNPQNLSKQQIKDIKVLLKDAELLKQKILSRTEAINKVLPEVTADLIKEENELYKNKAMVVNKLLQKPCLFTAEGRPYRNPWTYRHDNQAQNVTLLENDNIIITFNKNIDLAQANYLRSFAPSLVIDNKILTITRDEFTNLTENSLFPEHSPTIQNVNYLEITQLEQLAAAYNDSSQETINMIRDGADSSAIEESLKDNSDGFSKHLLLKLYCQNYLTLKQDRGINFDAAFAVAKKFDCLQTFNTLLVKAAQNDGLDDEGLSEFTALCQTAVIDCSHTEAIVFGQALRAKAQELIATFELPPFELADPVPEEDVQDAELDAQEEILVASQEQQQVRPKY